MFMQSDEPEHRRQFRDSVTDFAADRATPRDLRTERGGDINFSSARYQALAELGCSSILLPEAFGGLELEHGDLVALHHELGRAALTEPFAIVPLMVAQTLACGSNPALAAEMIPDLVAAERLASFAWQAAAGGVRTTDIGPVATADAEGWQLTGQAVFAPLATVATALVVAARCEDGVALFWLDEMPAVSDLRSFSDGSKQGTVCFDGTRVGADALIAGPQDGARLLQAALDRGRLAASAELLGLMERALEMTLEHLRQREQFGKPIGSFQALQHRAVNLYIQIELTRSAVNRAARAMDSGAEGSASTAQVSAAKSRAGDAAQLIARECVQMHGAIGYTTEYDLSLYVNRMLFLSAWLGNARAHRGVWLDHQAEAKSND